MDGLRKADDGLSNGILFSSRVGVATQQVVLCLDWCASTGQPEFTPSNARTRLVTSSTGKRSAVKVARCVWTGGKAVRPYLSVLRVHFSHKEALFSIPPENPVRKRRNHRTGFQFLGWLRSKPLSQGGISVILTNI